MYSIAAWNGWGQRTVNRHSDHQRKGSPPLVDFGRDPALTVALSGSDKWPTSLAAGAPTPAV
jgi:hypothetical protein